jgi:hypothetical protein
VFLSLLVLVPPAPAADKEAIDRAVERGVAHLKKMQREDGTWRYTEIGATALAGLALLEADVPPNDRHVRKAADAVRSASIPLTRTYSLSLSLLFLDRLGDEADVPLIESLAVRLLAGQTARGGWHYECPPLTDSEARQLRGLLQQRRELTTRRGTGEGTRAPDKPGDPRRPSPQRLLSEEIRQRIEVINRGFGGRRLDVPDDNSNTQFATLALWVARRYGLPTGAALARVNARFRDTQNEDGGWGYQRPGSRNGQSTATMTCAGLLGLAIGQGVAGDAMLRTDRGGGGDKPREGDRGPMVPDPSRDPVLRDGLLALGTALDHPEARRKGRPAPTLAHGGGRLYYFLWSVERVAVALDLETIGDKDWYGWGSEILLANQHPDGSWRGAYATMGADTCFALLFLKRANLARDLTLVLKGKVKDPGEVQLTAGGVGGQGVKKHLGLKPALESPDIVNGQGSGGDGREAAKPPAGDGDAEASKLTRQLVQAPAAKQGALIDEMRDGKGVVYTEALAAAIPKLEGSALKKAREALAERLARMTSETLGAKLADDSPEVRRAAALAVAMKEDRAHVKRLIELLDDKETVARAAHAALKSLSGQDFGPPAEASRAEKKKAIDAWREWSEKEGKR